MNKPHRNNSDFQLRYFLAGGCHTPDGAWMLMYDHKIDIETKIQHTIAQKIRRDALIAERKDFIAQNSNMPGSAIAFAVADAQATIIEASSVIKAADLNLQAAQNELDTINQIMAELEPLRKYKDLPLLDANEAAQRDEWLGELKCRAENFLLSQGTIPFDHLATMRQHPDFETEIAPHINAIVVEIKGKAMDDRLRAVCSCIPKNNPVLTGSDQ